MSDGDSRSELRLERTDIGDPGSTSGLSQSRCMPQEGGNGMKKLAVVAGLCVCLSAGARGAEPFTDIGAGLTGVYNCSLAWGDYDNDGDLDLALAGGTGRYVHRHRRGADGGPRLLPRLGRLRQRRRPGPRPGRRYREHSHQQGLPERRRYVHRHRRGADGGPRLLPRLGRLRQRRRPGPRPGRRSPTSARG
jgi:hypothetical protein